MKVMVGTDFKEVKLFAECSDGTKIQSKTLEFIKRQWKIVISLRDVNYYPNLGVKMFKIRLFDADDTTYLGIKESGKTVEIVVPAGTFNLEIANGVYLQFDVKKIEKLEEDSNEKDWDYDNEPEYEYEDEDWDYDDDIEEDNWNCKDENKEDS